MSEKTAKTHTAVSNRARAKQALERKVVYKSVLDNPHRIQWPSIPMNIGNSLLSRVIALLDGVASYHLLRDQVNRARKKARRLNDGTSEGRPPKKAKKDGMHLLVADSNQGTDVTPGDSQDMSAKGQQEEVENQEVASPGPPAVLRFLTIGVNEVTKRLEAQAIASRQAVTSSNDGIAVTAATLPSPLRMILACSADIDPPILIGHLPGLVATCNSAARGPTLSTQGTPAPIKLVPLPKGAEYALSEALGLRRASVVAIDADAPGLSMLDDLIDQVPTLAASWLTPQSLVNPEQSLVPTHIKQLRTSAPKDIKAAKQKRAEGKAAAKERQRRRRKELSDRKTRLSITT
ncbi:hypothetical protein GLOTRDRAFT_67890 [Gloeophyllum trabeum ATCC 11539]|uniref:Uncharacterized protein n=1 Tax=Gloeophyllum trabeum (strain ATCC 11539 / FP-39264 / Madison 617) TaxID=670483 RepID=S7QLP6_GLOTA|nr:uncharacterized protein GLOTRDRAFT_67890 [Gloeophyllum trabeum ATCC 11539]EPQ60348.1 hypothetical protein GLOTRDRAFT_67890 [Gloeophyllum trabeum ATCC 11539]